MRPGSEISEARFSTPAYLAIHEAIRATGLAFTGDPGRWVEQLLQEVPEPLRPLVSELAVVPLPASTADGVLRYCRDILARLFELQITRVKAEKMGQLQRLDASSDPEEFQRLNREAHAVGSAAGAVAAIRGLIVRLLASGQGSISLPGRVLLGLYPLHSSLAQLAEHSTVKSKGCWFKSSRRSAQSPFRVTGTGTLFYTPWGYWRESRGA